VVTVMPVVAHDLGGLRLYGWVFSGFMLGSVIGIVAAGRQADRRGPAVPFVAGVIMFGGGLAIAGLAPSMGVLVAGRALQGLGAGAVPAVAYAAIGRSLAGSLRARMMAVMSTAWVAPGLAGPAVSAEVARLFGWRWVFLGLLPIVAVAGSLAVPALIRLGPPAPAPAGAASAVPGHRLADGIGVAAGAALTLAGLTLAGSGSVLAGLGLVAAGLLVELPTLRRLVPAGTLLARPGLPATILLRGMLTFAFFGADAYVTLTISTIRHHSPVLAGLALTGATLAWTAGAWVQARLSDVWEGRRLVRTGLVIILAGIAGMTLVLRPGVPVAVALAAWTVAGLGMGLAYAPLSLLMLQRAPAGQEGQASASLNLTDTLGTATGIGIGGAAVAAAAGGHLDVGVAVAFAVAAAMGVAALALSSRLPSGTSSSPG
jgi:MFS family permease